MPFMTRIPSDLARFGLRVELVPGWQTRGSSSFAPGGVTCHWTAGPRGTTGRPSLNICTNGRPGIPGPLCNLYLARDGTCVVVAAGRANHAGVGGFRGLVGNSAVYGIEAESGGDGDWTPAQREAYPRLVAALLSGLARDASWAHGHHEWAPTRKIDVRDLMPAIRSGAAAILANPTPTLPEDDMTPDERQMLADIHHTLTPGVPNKKDVGPVYWNVIDGRNQAAALRGEIAGLKTALQQLASAPGQAVDLGAVQAAARAGAEEAFVEGVDLNLTVGGQRLDTV